MKPFVKKGSNNLNKKWGAHSSSKAAERLSGLEIPRRLIIIIALAVFNGELLIMIFLYLLPPLPLYARAIIDSTTLVLVLSPVLYFFVFRPLVRHFNDLKRAQIALRKSERQLVQAEKMSSLGMLVSAIAHELQNPNGVFTLNLPILKEYLAKLLPLLDRQFKNQDECIIFRMSYREIRKDITRLIDNLIESSNDINTYITNLKEYSRYHEDLKLELVDLRSVVDQVLAICGTQINKSIQAFTKDIPDDLPPVFTDVQALKQILLNLLINATQAVDKEFSTLKLRAVSGNSRQPHTIIEISDNGCGMDEMTREKIFDPFFTTRFEMKGTGLGLYICQNLVETLEGHIEVESEPGKGSVFRVIIPNQAAEEIQT